MSCIGPAFLPLTHDHPLVTLPTIRSRNWLFKPLHIFSIHCLTTHDDYTKNYCMKINKQMKINNPKNITKFKVICIGWIHTHSHTLTQKVWKIQSFPFKRFELKCDKVISQQWPFFLIFTYPQNVRAGHMWIFVSLLILLYFYIEFTTICIHLWEWQKEMWQWL